MDLKGVGSQCGPHLSFLGCGSVACSCEHGNEPSVSFLDPLFFCLLLKDCTARS